MEEVGSRTGPNTTSEESLETVEEDAQQNDTVHGERRRWTRWLPSIFLGLSLPSGVSGTAYWLLDRPSSNTVEIFLATATPMSAHVAHVSGAVVAPGVYTLELDSRVEDAIAAAGGALPGADIHASNLAALVTDGQRIEVAVSPQSASGGDGSTDAITGFGVAGTSSSVGGLVDLNGASLLELASLPGIGSARAQSIIDWRTANGPFETLDSLRDIPGIGPETVSGIRGLVTPE
ncbi:MAG: ComEA family DNA-binding protein [Dehalococcoidia bacterium]